MFGRWRRALERKSFDASNEHGWDLRKAQLGEGDLADYFTKMAHEVTGAAGKHGRSHRGRTPMQLLADAVDTYCAETSPAGGNGRRHLTGDASSPGRAVDTTSVSLPTSGATLPTKRSPKTSRSLTFASA